jgi:maltodextrin utilization protein YvdJ
LLLFCCQEAIDSIGSCITRSLFTYSSAWRANNRCCICHTTSTCIEQFVALKTLVWAYLHTMLLQITSSSVKMVYL